MRGTIGESMDLNEVVIFARVVQAGSVTRAARQLGLPKSTVSRKVSELEERLGIRLLQRTTRKLSLTGEGRAYYPHCARVVSELEAAERAVTELHATPHGRLRVSAPLHFGFLGHITAEYLSRYPEVSVEVVCTDRLVDLVEEGFDLAVRVGRLGDSSLVARKLGTSKRILVASPDYLEARPPLRTPNELGALDALCFGLGEDETWRLERGGQHVELKITGRIVANDFELLHRAALAGAGIGMLPLPRVSSDLRYGRLRHVLPDWRSTESPVSVVYPSVRHLSPKVKAFVDLLFTRMHSAPWEIEDVPRPARPRRPRA